LAHVKAVCRYFYWFLVHSLLFISDLFEEKPNVWAFCPNGSYLEYNGSTGVKDKRPYFQLRGQSESTPCYSFKQLFHALKSKLATSGLCLQLNTPNGCGKKSCTYLHVFTKCFQPGHAKHACLAGFKDWGCIKINGYPLSLFLDPAFQDDWKQFQHIKTNHNASSQLVFFKTHPSSWFTTREFLAIYSTAITKSGGYSLKDEAIIEENALKILEKMKDKPIRRYYGQITWNISHIPILEQTALQQLLDSIGKAPDDEDDSVFSLELDSYEQAPTSHDGVITQLPTPKKPPPTL